ncbi:MAG TPA: hypothetical protein VEM76_04315 [Anaeromyxobacteraceae bacterium]|nr:hypothetical protein [Anaeromyxobacteraceae bacterium]
MRVFAAVVAIAIAAPTFAEEIQGPSASLPTGPGATGSVRQGGRHHSWDGLGPKLSLVNLPTPAFGVEAKFMNLVGASFDYGFIPDVTLSNVTVGMKNWSIGAKVYPFHGSFFLGAAFGGRSFTGSKIDDSTGTPLKATVDVSSTYLAPEIGWRWVRNSGFFMGMDLGWQFVVSNSTTLTAPAGVSQSTRQDVQDKGNQLGRSGLPILGLLQVGFFL